jgi:4-amino-4-deoxy-L-arabinose transferase-like glycosyltransferase
MLTKRRSLICLLLLIGFSALLDSVVALKMSVTSDEPVHLRYGVHILHFRPDRRSGGYFDSMMPISALNAFPQAIVSFLASRHWLPHLSAVLGRFKVARFPTILATLVLNLLVYMWAYDLYGAGPAFAACLLCTLSPNLIAHGTLATTDMYHALGVVGSLFFFRRYLLQPTLGHALLSGLALALAQVTKPFALSLYAVVFLAIALMILRRTPFRSLTPRHLLAFAAIAVACFLVIINIAYSFDRTFVRLESYRFQSRLFTRFQQTPFLRLVPVPLPYPFLQGLDMTKHNEETGNSSGNIYLLGELADSHSQSFHGFKSYYAVALFFKEPIALQILFFWGLVWTWRNRSLVDFLLGEGLLLAAAAILVLWLSFFSRVQIGIRHILPALGIEIVIAGAAFSGFSSMPRAKKALLCISVLWLAVSVASYYPHMIPYMNEWVRDRRLSYRILADSNLDWGQDAGVVEAFVRKNPDVILDPPGPVAGRILVGANRLTGVDRWNPSAVFLARQYRPVAHVGYAHFLFVVPAKDIPSGSP